ncbi:ASCH domain-containing protein [Kitasatospora sp. NPDC094015]|uniref:ASCH domain-containing protein n=1 Tax=Kitasatospora sp. NPDC094015 TaxID=3155205 RepID=UPI003329EC94
MIDDRYTGLPKAEFAFPGPLRDTLVAAVLSGAKTSTTGLLAEYRKLGEPLPTPGQRQAVVDSGDLPVAVIEVTEVRVVPLGETDLQHALDEGEGYRTLAEWRAVHERFWRSPELLEVLEDREFTVDDATEVVLERFRVVVP